MQSAYPLNRCPACKKAFRMEITRLASPPISFGGRLCAPIAALNSNALTPNTSKGQAFMLPPGSVKDFSSDNYSEFTGMCFG